MTTNTITRTATRTITVSDTNPDAFDVTVNGEIVGVVFHEPYAAQPGHRFDGKPYAAWTAANGHLAERFVTLEAAADAIAPQGENPERTARRAEVHGRPHLMSVKGGRVHYGDDVENRAIPACRQSRGNIVATFYRAVDLPVTCTVCIGRYGADA